MFQSSVMMMMMCRFSQEFPKKKKETVVYCVKYFAILGSSISSSPHACQHITTISFPGWLNSRGFFNAVRRGMLIKSVIWSLTVNSCRSYLPLYSRGGTLGHTECTLGGKTQGLHLARLKIKDQILHLDTKSSEIVPKRLTCSKTKIWYKLTTHKKGSSHTNISTTSKHSHCKNNVKRFHSISLLYPCNMNSKTIGKITLQMW